MALVLTDEQEMLREAARGFLTDNAPVSQLRSLRDKGSQNGFDQETWQKMAEMGWAGVLVDEAHGGVAMGHQEAGLIMEEMGRTLSASPFLSSAIMGSTILSRAGSVEQKSEWLPKVASGEGVLGVAVDEGRKHQPALVNTTATRSGNGFKISGTKTFVADCTAADAYIVSARTSGKANEEQGITLFLVPKSDAVGIEMEDMVDSRNAGTVHFNDVEVTADAVLGEVDNGAPELTILLDAGRCGLAAEMSGSAQECLSRTVAYLKERKQFGQVIGTFQGLQHRAAHLYSEIEVGKSIVMRALEMMDTAPQMAAMMTSAAKAKMGQVALLSAQEAIQMHGGIGMTDEFDIGFFIKRIRVANALYGDHNFHTERYAQIRGF